MNIKDLILKQFKKQNEVRTADIVEKTGKSRAFINRVFQELRNEGKIILLGKANQARYILAKPRMLIKSQQKIKQFKRLLQNHGLSEDLILEQIERETGIFNKLSKNIHGIIDYAFTEMLNNAIEHSLSKTIMVSMAKNQSNINFQVVDKGVGIFNKIIRKKRLKNELEAIQDLTKGKQTTAPKGHSGEGIFFTSKAGDTLTIQSGQKKIIFNNLIDDIFISTIKQTKGTKVNFSINLKSKKRLEDVFKQYTGKAFDFSKTKVAVKLYNIDTDFVSRSQARRVVGGLDRFKNIILDFKEVATVGQAFVDEIFRVWQIHHPQIKIDYKNANENIDFMIKRLEH